MKGNHETFYYFVFLTIISTTYYLWLTKYIQTAEAREPWVYFAYASDESNQGGHMPPLNMPLMKFEIVCFWWKNLIRKTSLSLAIKIHSFPPPFVWGNNVLRGYILLLMKIFPPPPQKKSAPDEKNPGHASDYMAFKFKTLKLVVKILVIIMSSHYIFRVFKMFRWNILLLQLD